MTNAFRHGEQVMAYYHTDGHHRGGWYKGVIDGVQSDGNYLVRWNTIPTLPNYAPRLPVVSSVDRDEIKRLPSRGSYSAGF